MSKNKQTSHRVSSAHGIGAPVRRKEDARFLTGQGRYSDDVNIDGQAYAVVVRSPHPHARILAVDTGAARRQPGVQLVLSGADIADSVKPLASLTRTEPFNIPNRDGSPMPEPDQPVLALDKVRFAGEAVALVVADTLEQAQQGAQHIDVGYQVLPALMSLPQALAADTSPIWDECPDNVSFEYETGDAQATDQAFANAVHIARVELLNNRIAPLFMEPRSAVAEFDNSSGRLTLHAGSQTAHRMQTLLAQMLDLDPRLLRVVTPDVGGGFGARGAVYPEMALLLIAAQRLRRAVKWTAERSESFLSDTQARDHVLRGELAMDANGAFTALRVNIDWRHGAYIPSRGIWVIIRFLTPTLGGVYRIPRGHVLIRGVFSNTTPTAAYRGVGRVEATYLMESLMDQAATQSGLDRIAVRQANMVRESQMPYTSVGGARYEACTFAPHLQRALQLADWDAFAQRRKTSGHCGDQRGGEPASLRGIGCAVYVENDGGAPSEFARVSVHSDGNGDGTVSLHIGTQNFGMGHETVYAQVLSDRLQVPFDAVEVVDGDTDSVPRGAGSHGSRSMRVGGEAIVRCSRQILQRANQLAAQMLQAEPDELQFIAGEFVAGDLQRTVSLFDVAAFARSNDEPLSADVDFEQQRESCSSGCHVCEVSIDTDTGKVSLLRHVLVTDVGTVVNPMIVHGQIHGGAAQGIGQAAMEEVIYDPHNGQTITGSLMDYVLPRADDLPFFITELAHTRESDNELGVKGVGEGPTTGAPAAYMNAVRDALSQAGADAVDMPASAQKVWRALRDARARRHDAATRI